MPRSNILNNPGFRIAILDVNRKTAEIALSYGIAESHCRTLRRQYGRPCANYLPHGYVSSGRWQRNLALVHDVRTLRVKELMAKYNCSMPSVCTMRAQLGITVPQVIQSKEFIDAVKTKSVKEVMGLFGISQAIVVRERRRLGVFKPSMRLSRNPKFIKDCLSKATRDVVKKWRCTDAYVRTIRAQVRRRDAQ